MDKLLLNIGCGNHPLPGFLNLDIGAGGDRQHDVRLGLPFPQASVAGIFNEHFLEHLTQAEGIAFLRECRRVLTPGGVLRVATPDLDAVVREYSSSGWLNEEWRRHGYDWLDNRCEMLNLGMREWGHRWVYNEEELLRLADLAGLEPRGRCAWGESDLPHFRGLEYRQGSRLIVEFQRPLRRVPAEPLVSVVITAWNEEFFPAALKSALDQTYRRLEVIVGDDSPGEAIERCCRESHDPRILYTRNSPRLGGWRNRLACFERAGGEFIKFLNDDDLLDPGCLERMVPCLQAHPEVTLVTSHRRIVDRHGAVLPEIRDTRRPVAADSLIEGLSLAGVMLGTRANFTGEPSTVLFRRADLAETRPHILSFAGRPCLPNGDVTMWTNLLSKGDAIYLASTLSSFRVHDGQCQKQPEYAGQGWEAWEQMRADATRMGMPLLSGWHDLKTRPLWPAPWWPAPVQEAARRAAAALEERDAAAAVRALSAGWQQVPRDPALAVALARVLEVGGDNAAAGELLDDVLASHPACAPAWIERARLESVAGRAEAAKDALAAGFRAARWISFSFGFTVDEGAEIWMYPKGSIRVLPEIGPAELELEIAPAAPGNYRRYPFEVNLETSFGVRQSLVLSPEADSSTFRVTLPQDGGGATLELHSEEAFIPAETGWSADTRSFSLLVKDLRLRLLPLSWPLVLAPLAPSAAGTAASVP